MLDLIEEAYPDGVIRTLTLPDGYARYRFFLARGTCYAVQVPGRRYRRTGPYPTEVIGQLDQWGVLEFESLSETPFHQFHHAAVVELRTRYGQEMS